MSMKGNAPLSFARTIASLLLISSMAVMGGSTAFAGQILGFGLDGPIYSIDAVNGNAVEVSPLVFLESPVLAPLLSRDSSSSYASAASIFIQRICLGIPTILEA